MCVIRLRSLVALGGVLAAVASVAFATTTFAEQQPGPAVTPVTTQTRQIHGTIKSIGGSSFVVTTPRHGDVTVTLPSGGLSLPRGLARHHNQAGSHLITNLSELHVLDRVVVQGRGQSGGTFAARRIHLLHHAKTDHVVGTFKSFSGTTLTLTVNRVDKQFTINATTVVRPADKSLGSITGTPTITVVSRDGTTASAVHIHS